MVASSASAAGPSSAGEYPYKRFDVVGTAAERCDELRRMTDEDVVKSSAKKLKVTGNVALQQSADVPAHISLMIKPWLLGGRHVTANQLFDYCSTT